MRKYVFAFLVTLAACNHASDKAAQPQGNEGANGGDQLAQQATAAALEAVSIVERAKLSFPEVNVLDLRATVNKTRIIMVDHAYANGVETDASNNGVDLIQVSRTRWPDVKDHNQKLALLFHELLSILGVEKNNYAVSGRLLRPEFRFTSGVPFNCGGSPRVNVFVQYDPAIEGFVVNNWSSNFGSSLALFKKIGDSFEAYPKLTTSYQYKELVVLSSEKVIFINGDGGSMGCFQEDLPKEKVISISTFECSGLSWMAAYSSCADAGYIYPVNDSCDPSGQGVEVKIRCSFEQLQNQK